MSEGIVLQRLARPARHPLAWCLVFLLAGLAWIPTLQQTLAMFSLPMYGTMGLTFAPFLCFWTVMMAAMMLPSLAPTASIRMTAMQAHTRHPLFLLMRTLLFLLGYLAIWGISGIPVYVLCLVVDRMVLTAPWLAQGLGMLLFIAAGLYQLTPLKRRALLHCHPSMRGQGACSDDDLSAAGWMECLQGMRHGLTCLSCCGILMLVLIPVGLMNLYWMVLMMLVVFFEKVASHDYTFSLLLGALLIFYGLLAFISPGFLPGLFPA